MKDESNEDLITAIQFHNIEEVKSLLCSCDVNLADENGMTPLAHAVCSIIGPPNEAIVKLLLEKGANVSLPFSREQWTVLHHAAYFQRPTIIRLLLEAGADTRVADKSGNTPLMQALLAGNTQQLVIDELLNHCAQKGTVDLEIKLASLLASRLGKSHMLAAFA